MRYLPLFEYIESKNEECYYLVVNGYNVLRISYAAKWIGDCEIMFNATEYTKDIHE